MATEKKSKGTDKNGGKREGAGRKPAKIDWQKVDNFLLAGCDGSEIAPHFGIDAQTLYRHCKAEKKVDFEAYKREKQSQGDSLLRAAQFKKAIQEGDNTMLVWLGKQRLNQSDKKQVDHKNDGGAFEPTQVVFGKGQSNG